jgi:hypothetical protein
VLITDIITDVNKAERIVEQLSRSHKELLARGEELSSERAALSFAALAEENVESQTKLRKLNAEAATLNLEIENVASALNEAGKRLRAAQEAEELEAKRQDATELRRVAYQLGQQAIDLDAALASVAALGAAMEQTLNRVHELGASHPSHSQLQTLGSAAVLTALMPTPFKLQHLAPSERRTFSELALGWVQMLERGITQLIGPEQSEAA